MATSLHAELLNTAALLRATSIMALDIEAKVYLEQRIFSGGRMPKHAPLFS
jgi:hypothetical protein